LSAAVTEY